MQSADSGGMRSFAEHLQRLKEFPARRQLSADIRAEFPNDHKSFEPLERINLTSKGHAISIRSIPVAPTYIHISLGSSIPWRR
jgi:hypothetical protein